LSSFFYTFHLCFSYIQTTIICPSHPFFLLLLFFILLFYHLFSLPSYLLPSNFSCFPLIFLPYRRSLLVFFSL
jgi:hypothetical protein